MRPSKHVKSAPKRDAAKLDRLALRIQYGALGYREDTTRQIEILLITSRQTKRWIIPKGWPIKGMKPNASAAQEAFEEAGVRGNVSKRPIGQYIYSKLLRAGLKAVPCELYVYSLHVIKQELDWPEAGQREIRWCHPLEAIALVDEIQLSNIIASFVAQIIRIGAKPKKSDKPRSAVSSRAPLRPAD